MENNPPILCIGGMHFDSIARSQVPIQLKASNPVRYVRAAGGVAHNIACDMVALGASVSLLTLVGDDIDGDAILADTGKRGVDLSLAVQKQGIATASYTAVLDPGGELAIGLSDTDTYDLITPEFLAPYLDQIHQHRTIVVDANLPERSLLWLSQNKGPARLYAAPVSPSKAMRWHEALEHVDVLICNEREAEHLTGLPVGLVSEAGQAGRALRDRGPDVAVVTLGPQGAVIISPDLDAHFTIPETRVIDVNGAGDAFFAGFTQALHAGSSAEDAMNSGIATASLIAETSGPVWDEMSADRVAARKAAVPSCTPVAD